MKFDDEIKKLLVENGISILDNLSDVRNKISFNPEYIGVKEENKFILFYKLVGDYKIHRHFINLDYNGCIEYSKKLIDKINDGKDVKYSEDDIAKSALPLINFMNFDVSQNVANRTLMANLKDSFHGILNLISNNLLLQIGISVILIYMYVNFLIGLNFFEIILTGVEYNLLPYFFFFCFNLSIFIKIVFN